MLRHGRPGSLATMSSSTLSVSVFDLFKIGIGPSSSHTVGPMIAARQFAVYLRASGVLAAVHCVTVELFGSLSATGVGHGTDRAVLLGLAGHEPDRIDPEQIAPTIAQIRSSGALALLGELPTVHTLILVPVLDDAGATGGPFPFDAGTWAGRVMGWAEALAGVTALVHTASPFPGAQPKDPAAVIRPAVEGTERVLKAAAAAGVGRGLARHESFGTEVAEVAARHPDLLYPPLGYELVLRHLAGSLALPALTQELAVLTTHYARRQRTWFRKEPDLRWFRSAEQIPIDALRRALASQYDEGARDPAAQDEALRAWQRG